MHTCLLNYRKINMQNACAERHAKTSSEEQKAKQILPKVKIVQHALSIDIEDSGGISTAGVYRAYIGGCWTWQG